MNIKNFFNRPVSPTEKQLTQRLQFEGGLYTKGKVVASPGARNTPPSPNEDTSNAFVGAQVHFKTSPGADTLKDFRIGLDNWAKQFEDPGTAKAYQDIADSVFKQALNNQQTGATQITIENKSLNLSDFTFPPLPEGVDLVVNLPSTNIKNLNLSGYSKMKDCLITAKTLPETVTGPDTPSLCLVSNKKFDVKLSDHTTRFTVKCPVPIIIQNAANLQQFEHQGLQDSSGEQATNANQDQCATLFEESYPQIRDNPNCTVIMNKHHIAGVSPRYEAHENALEELISTAKELQKDPELQKHSNKLEQVTSQLQELEDEKIKLQDEKASYRKGEEKKQMMAELDKKILEHKKTLDTIYKEMQEAKTDEFSDALEGLEGNV